MISNELLRIRQVIHSRVHANWSFTPRIPDYHTLTFVEVGSLRYTVRGEALTVGAGEVIVMPSGLEKVGENAARKEGAYYSFHFYCELPRHLSHGRGNHIANGPVAELTGAFRCLHQHWLAKDELCCLGYAQVVLGLLPTPGAPDMSRVPDPRVERMRQYLLAHVEERIELETLAGIAGVSRAYAGTLFHKQTGMTVQNYANALRVRKAQALLTESWDTLARIADQCGFDDVFYFSKVFKKHTGNSPQDYRLRYT